MKARLIIAGGGLSGVLAATAFANTQDPPDILLLEGGKTLGGNHTWSFYATDLGPAETDLVAPFITHSWAGYDVAFEGFSRTLSTPYRAISSDTLHAVATAHLGGTVRLNAPVAALDAAGVTLKTGERLTADAVIDARGAKSPSDLAGTVVRWQSFFGQEVRLQKPHGLSRPTIMDATVPQRDGYRFVYLLPFSADTLLIEDTYYTDSPAIDAATLRTRIKAYADTRNWTIEEVLREEQGALPLILAADHASQGQCTAGSAAAIGAKAGLFHPVTGYSLPLAARTATALAARKPPITSQDLKNAMTAAVTQHMAASRFDRLLNRLLFLAGAPQDRHKVLARFHTLPQPLIERFYASRLTRADKARILCGKPPVPVLKAIAALPESAAKPAKSALD